MSLDSLIIYESSSPKIRIGSKNDGGYVIADNIKYDCLISCGISNDITFEKNFLNKYNVPCFAFDGTIDSLPEIDERIQFIRQNISYYNSKKFTNLQDLIGKYKNIFLKMDIETFEFRWIQSIPPVLLNNINQIVIEFHFPFTNKHFEHLDAPLPVTEKMEVLEKIAEQFTLIHLHANNCCGTTSYDGVTVPNVFECTYVHKSIQPHQKRNTIPIPHPLDSPNTPNPEIHLQGYPFTV
jgi:hypothetical protein